MALYLKTDSVLFDDKNFGRVDSYVNYLQSDGQAYIDTLWTGYRSNTSDVAGNIPNNIPRFEIKIVTNETAYVPIIGTTSNTQPTIDTNGSKIQYVGKGAKFDKTDLANGENILEVGSVCSYLNETQIADNSNMSNQYRINAYPNSNILLFGGYYTTSGGSALTISSNTKIYYFKAYEGDTLVLDLRPYRHNGIGCMRDAVTGSFYMNAGTGNFTIG